MLSKIIPPDLNKKVPASYIKFIEGGKFGLVICINSSNKFSLLDLNQEISILDDLKEVHLKGYQGGYVCEKGKSVFLISLDKQILELPNQKYIIGDADYAINGDIGAISYKTSKKYLFNQIRSVFLYKISTGEKLTDIELIGEGKKVVKIGEGLLGLAEGHGLTSQRASTNKVILFNGKTPEILNNWNGPQSLVENNIICSEKDGDRYFLNNKTGKISEPFVAFSNYGEGKAVVIKKGKDTFEVIDTDFNTIFSTDIKNFPNNSIFIHSSFQEGIVSLGGKIFNDQGKIIFEIDGYDHTNRDSDYMLDIHGQGNGIIGLTITLLNSKTNITKEEYIQYLFITKDGIIVNQFNEDEKKRFTLKPLYINQDYILLGGREVGNNQFVYKSFPIKEVFSNIKIVENDLIEIDNIQYLCRGVGKELTDFNKIKSLGKKIENIDKNTISIGGRKFKKNLLKLN